MKLVQCWSKIMRRVPLPHTPKVVFACLAPPRNGREQHKPYPIPKLWTEGEGAAPRSVGDYLLLLSRAIVQTTFCRRSTSMKARDLPAYAGSLTCLHPHPLPRDILFAGVRSYFSWRRRRPFSVQVSPSAILVRTPRGFTFMWRNMETANCPTAWPPNPAPPTAGDSNSPVPVQIRNRKSRCCRPTVFPENRPRNRHHHRVLLCVAHWHGVMAWAELRAFECLGARVR